MAFFRYLDGKTLRAISQGIEVAISNLLAMFVGTALLAGINVAYHQCLWNLFRRKFLRVLVIDKLWTLVSSPWNVFNFHLIRSAPLGWLISMACLLVPVALIFPPGAVNVLPQAGVDRLTQAVPTLNISALVSPDYETFLRYKLFNADIDTYCK
jgi:hypothetical protein